MSEAAGDALVELVDPSGRTLGSLDKLAAHRAPGRHHRAISAFLLDGRGRLLLQRRAAGKYHSAGLWSNTCCSHPAPGEPPAVTAARRLAEELGIQPVGLTAAGTVSYRVADPASGLVEHEFNHLFVGRVLSEPAPDPREVAECALVSLYDLARMRATAPFSAWFPVVLDAALPSLRALGLR